MQTGNWIGCSIGPKTQMTFGVLWYVLVCGSFKRRDTEKGNDWQITGAGGKAFCAGMDLVNWNKERKSGADGQGTESHMPPTGFGGLSNRALARKPVIAAVNGYALGKLDSCMHHGALY